MFTVRYELTHVTPTIKLHNAELPAVLFTSALCCLCQSAEQTGAPRHQTPTRYFELSQHKRRLHGQHRNGITSVNFQIQVYQHWTRFSGWRQLTAQGSLHSSFPTVRCKIQTCKPHLHTTNGWVCKFIYLYIGDFDLSRLF